MIPLPDSFLTIPIAHRGLHDHAAGRPENSRAAFWAAIDAGYGIEMDIQPSRDGVPMVFHDYGLARLTGQSGPIQQRTAEELSRLSLLGTDETIPTLADVLTLTAGRVPLLIELKDQDGALGPNVGSLERAVADVLAGYDGPAAVMSFNPHSVAALAEAAPNLPRGLVTEAYADSDTQMVPPERRDALRKIPDVDRVGAGFISHQASDLSRPRVQELKESGLPILCWTIRSPEQEAEARKTADNITFEGYAAAHPGA
ncbi:glycerophosphodiester phosphodiesterase family protein [Aliiroseovarius sp. YM-037]|uniref:glycerophosphodiester phosphodiesterase family protein n=1 Tax=Aliiroseovarius sp. YM-037 TaxID=3341728 RepID=UPI003A808284